MYCFVCSLFPEGPEKEKSDNAWYRTGVRSWHKMKSVGKQKAGKLEQHFSSRAHNAALTDLLQFSKSGDLRTLLDKEARLKEVQIQSDIYKNREVVNILLDTVRTLSKLGLAFRR